MSKAQVLQLAAWNYVDYVRHKKFFSQLPFKTQQVTYWLLTNKWTKLFFWTRDVAYCWNSCYLSSGKCKRNVEREWGHLFLALKKNQFENWLNVAFGESLRQLIRNWAAPLAHVNACWNYFMWSYWVCEILMFCWNLETESGHPTVNVSHD